MGITQNTGASSLIKPGVIDNTAARPASPYEGQVIFQKDTDQLLVWNGTAWVIPNSPAQNPSGLELISTTTVGSAASSVVVSNSFNSIYDHYKIIYSGGTGTTGNAVRLYIHNLSNGWYGNLMYSNFSSGALAAGFSNEVFVNWAGGCSNQYWHVDIDVYSPFLAQSTVVRAPFVDGSNAGTTNGFNANHTSGTGFTLTPSGGTLNGGTVKLYGYRK